MPEAIKHLFEIMDRSNKQTQIKNLGSIKGSHMEKIRSGQSYLYKKQGMESEVFEVRFKEHVSGSCLNQALGQAMRRFPYCNAKVVELDGDFYIVRNDNAAVARKTKVLPRLGSIQNTYHLTDVTYFDNSVFISFHHALCDGRGIKPFIETLLYYYCKSKYSSTAGSEGIRLAGEPLLEGEAAEPFSTSYDYDESKEFPEISRDGFPIPENLAQSAPHSYRYELTFPQEQFMAVCKANHATPAVLAALLMNQGIAALYPDYDKDIHANIATDMRDALGVPNTFKERPFCEVDNLVLAQLSYMNFSSIVPTVDQGNSILLAEAAEQYYAESRSCVSFGSRTDTILEAMANSTRYRNVELSNLCEIKDMETQIFFAVLHISLGDGTTYISFRGTEDGMLGRKEDFAMSYRVMGAQDAAADYLIRTI